MLVPLLAAAVIGAAGEPVHARPSHRCSCIKQVIRVTPPDSALRRLLLEQADAWFVGKVVRAEPAFRPLEEGGPDDSVSAGYPAVYAFSVDSAWKGVRTNVVVVYSRGGSVGCPDPVYRLGRRYVVEALRHRDALYVRGRCEPNPDPLPVEAPHVQHLMRFLGEPSFRRRRG
jgi:hypothetical protein